MIPLCYLGVSRLALGDSAASRKHPGRRIAVGLSRLLAAQTSAVCQETWPPRTMRTVAPRTSQATLLVFSARADTPHARTTRPPRNGTVPTRAARVRLARGLGSVSLPRSGRPAPSWGLLGWRSAWRARGTSPGVPDRPPIRIGVSSSSNSASSAAFAVRSRCGNAPTSRCR